jgi:hypothetical protein
LTGTVSTLHSQTRLLFRFHKKCPKSFSSTKCSMRNQLTRKCSEWLHSRWLNMWSMDTMECTLCMGRQELEKHILWEYYLMYWIEVKEFFLYLYLICFLISQTKTSKVSKQNGKLIFLFSRFTKNQSKIYSTQTTRISKSGKKTEKSLLKIS